MLIGTQMIAKGLDLPLVTLVGVVAADIGLFLPDFRAGERTFQLLTQVAGRAGRSALGGQVIVQTYHPDHYAIVAASHHDYEGFYRQEMAFRREQGYPPLPPAGPAGLLSQPTRQSPGRSDPPGRAAARRDQPPGAARHRPDRPRALLLRPAARPIPLAGHRAQPRPCRAAAPRAAAARLAVGH